MKIIYLDQDKHFLKKKQRSFATVVKVDHVSLYSIDPSHLTTVYTIKTKSTVKQIPASQVVRVL